MITIKYKKNVREKGFKSKKITEDNPQTKGTFGTNSGKRKVNQLEKTPYFLTLPYDIIQLIANQYLDKKSMCNLRLVCRHLRQILNKESVKKWSEFLKGNLRVEILAKRSTINGILRETLKDHQQLVIPNALNDNNAFSEWLCIEQKDFVKQLTLQYASDEDLDTFVCKSIHMTACVFPELRKLTLELDERIKLKIYRNDNSAEIKFQSHTNIQELNTGAMPILEESLESISGCNKLQRLTTSSSLFFERNYTGLYWNIERRLDYLVPLNYLKVLCIDKKGGALLPLGMFKTFAKALKNFLGKMTSIEYLEFSRTIWDQTMNKGASMEMLLQDVQKVYPKVNILIKD